MGIICFLCLLIFSANFRYETDFLRTKVVLKALSKLLLNSSLSFPQFTNLVYCKCHLLLQHFLVFFLSVHSFGNIP